MVGHKQKRLFNIIISKGFITADDISAIYNIKDIEKIKSKLKEFESMLWIKRLDGSEFPIKYGKGEDFPL